MTWLLHWLPTVLLFFQCAALGYAFNITRHARRHYQETTERLDAADRLHQQVGALLAHMTADHGMLHAPHSHEDSDFAPRVH